MSRLRVAALSLLLLSAAGSALAQQSGIPRAFELERRGDYAGAATAYRTLLAAQPANLAALLGLERVLLPLNQSAAILPQVRAALAADATNPGIYGVALRAWAAADQPDSIRATAERWAAAAPGDETPYREWGRPSWPSWPARTVISSWQPGSGWPRFGGCPPIMPGR